MKFILGKKLEMTQKYSKSGSVIPVTRIEAGPCVVTQVKTNDQDGYNGIQVGYGSKKRISKPLRGHLKNLGNFKYLKEFRLEDEAKNVGALSGDKIRASVFAVGDTVKVSGYSKGRGFQGVVKRWGFHGSPATHGHKDQLRMPGSSGAGGNQRVFKGVKKPGRMGNDQITVTNLEVIDIEPENNILYIKGAIPGSKNGLVWVTGEGDMKYERAEKPAVQIVPDTNIAAPAAAADKAEKKEESNEESNIENKETKK